MKFSVYSSIIDAYGVMYLLESRPIIKWYTTNLTIELIVYIYLGYLESGKWFHHLGDAMQSLGSGTDYGLILST